MFQNAPGERLEHRHRLTALPTLTKVRLWPGPGFLGGRPKLTSAGRAIAPKVNFLAPPRTHTGGQFRSSNSQEERAANGRFQGYSRHSSTAVRAAHSPKRSPKGPRSVPRWSAWDAGRMSAGRAAELELPTHGGPSSLRIHGRIAVGRIPSLGLHRLAPVSVDVFVVDSERSLAASGGRRHGQHSSR